MYDFWNGLEVDQDKSSYQNKLVAYLLDLSCQDGWAAVGIIKNRMVYSIFDNRKSVLLASSFAQCLLSLKDQKNKAGQLVCPAMSEIGKETVTRLVEVSAKKNSDSSIPSTFVCQTELSDKKQPSE